MPKTDYLEEDDHIAEEGAVPRMARATIKLGRAFTAMATVALALGSAGWFPLAASVLALGHSVKAISSFSNGQGSRGFKELLRGAAETAYSFYLPEMFGYLTKNIAWLDLSWLTYKPLHIMAEPMSVSLTGKTLTGNVGELVGNLLDGTTDAVKRRRAEQRRTQPVMQATMQPQVMVQPQVMQQPVVQYVQSPQMVQQVPVQYVSTVPAYVPGSISTVPATVGTVAYSQPVRTDPPPVQADPPQRNWTGYINGRRQAQAAAMEAMQAQAAGQPVAVAVPVQQRVQPVVAGSYAGAVSSGGLATPETSIQQQA